MADNGMRDELLFVGDVHLGRRPVGLADALEAVSLRASALSPAAALENVVQEALERPPRALVFAGDVLDQDKDRFEAYPLLEGAVRRLTEAGVPVYGVAGNHDGIALPRLARRVPGFHLLGEGGVWESVEVPGEGRPIDLMGWSFPRRHFPESPLDDPGYARVVAETRPGATLMGVLHCDLDASASRYAPVRRSVLEETDLAAWFLGHVHQPGALSTPRPIGYLGSLVGLDPGEPGPRGPWRVGLVDGGVSSEQLPLVPLRWETLTVELDDESAVDEDAVHQVIERAALARLRDDATFADPRLMLVVVRVTLIGRLHDAGPVRRFVAEHTAAATCFDSGSVPVIVERVHDKVRTAVDLDALSHEPSPIGHVVRILLAVRDGADADLLARTSAVVDGVARDGWDLAAEEQPLPPAREIVERAAWRVLDTLLEQRRTQSREVGL